MATNANLSGDTVAGPDRTVSMQMFDNLPKELRKVLANAVEDYSVYQVHWNLENGLATPEFIINAIITAELDKCGS